MVRIVKERGIMAKHYLILKKTIEKVIAECPIDIGGIYFVLKDIFRDVEERYFAQVNMEVAQAGGDEDAESISEN